VVQGLQSGGTGAAPARVPRFTPQKKYKNNIFLALECVCCPENGGAGALHFLVEHFSILGFDAQYWMLIAAVVVVHRTQSRL
jgi:hypothetical protein